MAILTSTPEIAAATGRFCWVLRLRVSVLVLSTMLAGCTVGPSFKSPKPEAPPGWSSWRGGDASLRDSVMRGNQAPVSERWYETFDDATLNALQTRARTANPDLRTAALHFAQSRAQRQTTAAQRGPQLNADAGESRQRESARGASTRLISAIAPANSGQLVQVLSDPYNLYYVGFDAS